MNTDQFIARLAKTRSQRWTYGFHKQVGAVTPGDLKTAYYYRHVIIGNPPEDYPRPLPGGQVHLWVDTCALIVFSPHLVRKEPGKPSWLTLGMKPDEAKAILAASCEGHGHDPELRARLLEATGLVEIPIPEREPTEWQTKSAPSLTSSSNSAVRTSKGTFLVSAKQPLKKKVSRPVSSSPS